MPPSGCPTERPRKLVRSGRFTLTSSRSAGVIATDKKLVAGPDLRSDKDDWAAIVVGTSSSHTPRRLECPEQPNPDRILVIIIVDQALPIAGKNVRIALDVSRQRKRPAELDRTALGREIAAQ